MARDCRKKMADAKNKSVSAVGPDPQKGAVQAVTADVEGIDDDDFMCMAIGEGTSEWERIDDYGSELDETAEEKVVEFECAAVSRASSSRITLDSASDDHVLPSSMVPEGACVRKDAGPQLRDVQRSIIFMQGTVNTPYADVRG